MKLFATTLLLINPFVKCTLFRGANTTNTWDVDNRELGESMYCPTGRDSSKKKKYTVSASSDKFAETSYMVYTRKKHKGHRVMWMGSDGEQRKIRAVDLQTGKIVHECELLNISKKNSDWESISLGPCSTNPDDGTCLYIGDTGNNDASSCDNRSCDDGRKQLKIYKLKEPSVFGRSQRSRVSVTTLLFDFSDSTFPAIRADSEAMFVDFRGDSSKDGRRGDIYIITKNPEKKKKQRLGKISVEEHANKGPGEHKVTLRNAGELSERETWNGADMSRDGHLIAVRKMSYVYFFPRGSRQTIPEALANPPCDFRSRTSMRGDARQFEAVTFIGTDMAEASECYKKKQCSVDVTVHRLEYSGSAASSD